jgi:hypothetical protein
MVGIAISKDNENIVSLKSNGKLDPEKGDFRNVTHNVNEPRLSFLLDNTNKYHGRYLCKIYFANGSDNVNTLIWQYNGANSYLIDKFFVFLSAFLLIFGSFK